MVNDEARESDKGFQSAREEAPGRVHADMTHDEFEAAVRDRVDQERRERSFATSPVYRSELTNLLESLLEDATFETGQLVEWKPGLQNKTFPHADSTGIVVEQISEPVFDTEAGPSSQYFREPLNLAVAVLVGDERQFAIYWYDSRRFRLAH